MKREVWTGVKPPEEKVFKDFPNEWECDVVIIGAGPNGLIAGAYLSRAGLKVTLCEKRYEIGGGLATEEILFPGNLTNTHAIYHMMVDWMPPIKDFGLEKYDLFWVKPSVQVSMIFGDGSTLTFGRMLQDSKDSVAKFSLKEADRFEKVMRTWRKIVSEILAPATYYPPLPPAEFFENLQKTDVGKELARLSEKSPAEIIDESFSGSHLKALLIYLVAMWGVDPEEEGMGFMVPLLCERATQKCYPLGGSHKFASALGKEICSSGGLILENAEVDEILIEGKRAVGVKLKDGTKIFAKVVISSLPPTQTFFELIKKLPEDIKQELEPLKDWKWDKWSFFTVHTALRRSPEFKTDDSWISKSFCVIVGANSFEDVIEFFRGLKEGKIKKFIGHITCESQLDPTLSRAGDHIAFFQMCAPYEFDWEKKKQEIEKEAMETWKKFSDLEVKQVVSETPVDIERRLKSMVKGSIKHGDYTPIQMGYFRPSESCSSTRTPVEGLYLCGASVYPGGLIIGGPGYICANTVAEDLGVKKWWEIPQFIQKYIRKYVEGR